MDISTEIFIEDAIQSVLSQSYRNIEIIAVDDGSVDNTNSIIQSLIVDNNHIKYIYQENKGQAAARNNGIRNANGNIIAFLDADDIWSHNKLEIQLKALEEQKVDLVSNP